MNRPMIRCICLASISALLWTSCWVSAAAADTASGTQKTWSFDDVAVGKLPAGWKVEATSPRGPLATWQVVKDKTAPSGARVLALTSPNHRSGRTFNICWTNAVSFRNGEIAVRLKAVKGRGDQGGGIMWRVLNRNNYYVVRYNPLEDNYRLYSVRNGHRRMIATATAALPAGEWIALRIVQHGAQIQCYLNGDKLIEAADSTLARAGGVGLWTKADAATSFDGFVVRAATPPK